MLASASNACYAPSFLRALLVVQARNGTPSSTPAERRRCCARASGPRDAPIELHVFNWTGDGLQSYHYYALVQVQDGASNFVVVDEARAGAASHLKCLPRGGRGRARQQPAAVLDLRSPPRAAVDLLAVSG